MRRNFFKNRWTYPAAHNWNEENPKYAFTSSRITIHKRNRVFGCFENILVDRDFLFRTLKIQAELSTTSFAHNMFEKYSNIWFFAQSKKIQKNRMHRQTDRKLAIKAKLNPPATRGECALRLAGVMHPTLTKSHKGFSACKSKVTDVKTLIKTLQTRSPTTQQW